MALKIFNPVYGEYDLLTKLKAIDRAGVTQRDILIMWGIHNHPGVMGIELAREIGFPSRSSVNAGLARLVRLGYIMDKREVVQRATPNLLYILPKGLEFLRDIMPAGAVAGAPPVLDL